jgi:hypothetical protein
MPEGFGIQNAHLILGASLGQMNFNIFGSLRGEILAHKICPDRKLPVPAIDQDRQLNGPRAAEVHDSVERRANGPAGKEDIIDQKNGTTGDFPGDFGQLDQRMVGTTAEIVAIEGDIHGAKGHLDTLEALDFALETLGEEIPARTNTNNTETVDAFIPLDNLVCDSGDRSLYGWSIQDQTAPHSFVVYRHPPTLPNLSGFT